MTRLGDLFLILGGLFCFLGALGIVRMPDVYNRIQTGTKAVTLGALSLLIGVFFYRPDWWANLLVIGLFILLTNPIGSSTLARAFYRVGVPVWHKPENDR